MRRVYTNKYCAVEQWSLIVLSVLKKKMSFTLDEEKNGYIARDQLLYAL